MREGPAAPAGQKSVESGRLWIILFARPSENVIRTRRPNACNLIKQTHIKGTDITWRPSDREAEN